MKKNRIFADIAGLENKHEYDKAERDSMLAEVNRVYKVVNWKKHPHYALISRSICFDIYYLVIYCRQNISITMGGMLNP